MYLKPADLNYFWQKVFYPVKTKDLSLRLEKQSEQQFHYIQNFTFKGFDDLELHGSIYRPIIRKDKYPVIIHYHGLNYHRGTPMEFKPFLDEGYAVLTYDFRHQGNDSTTKDDMKIYEDIDHHEKSTLLKLYIDGIRIINVASQILDFDMKRLCLHGQSQGGGIALAVAALDSRAKLILADVPSMSDFSCRIETKSGMFKTVAQKIDTKQLEKDKVLKSLAYFDLMHLAELITAEVLISVGSNDPVCPPRCFLKTYQRINSKKQLFTYETNNHDGGGLEHLKVKISRLKSFKQ